MPPPPPPATTKKSAFTRFAALMVKVAEELKVLYTNPPTVETDPPVTTGKAAPLEARIPIRII
jgi:hypothetical protein